jgi:hypothetical protein
MLYKQANFNIIKIIVELIKDKGLVVDFSKIKGYSGNFWNEEADRLAKEAIDLAYIDRNMIIDSNNLYSSLEFSYS